MTSDLARQLCGEPLQEFTSAGSMGTTDGPAPGLVRPLATKGRLARLRKRRDPEGRERYRLREDRDELIPDTAKELDINSGTATDTEEEDGDPESLQPAPTDADEPLLRTSLALVAPDCTPDGTKPLSPQNVPTATASPAPVAPQAPSPVPAQSAGPANTTEAAANGVLNSFLSGKMARQAAEAATARATAAATGQPGPIQEGAPSLPTAPVPMPGMGMSFGGGGANIHAPQAAPVTPVPGATARAFCNRIRFD